MKASNATGGFLAAVGLFFITMGIISSKRKNAASEAAGAKYGTSRGYRNNNPLNIVYNPSNAWQGEVRPSTDSRFCQFTSMAYGFRAALVLIRTYVQKYGLNTVQKIINRWAPASDGNNPTSYAQTVVRLSNGVFASANATVDPTNRLQMCTLVSAMATVENGSAPDETDVEKAWRLFVS